MSNEFSDEYADKCDIAKSMTVCEFAAYTKQQITLWGNPATYSCVKIGNTAYLWKLSNGEFDGWETKIVENVEQ